MKKRRAIQIFFFILIAAIAVNHTLAESGKGIPFLSEASLHAICPFGGVVTIPQLFITGTTISKIHSSAVILMVIVFVLAVFFGPVFCGWICPFGTFQEILGKLGKRIFKRKYNRMVPAKLDSLLRYLRYIVLALVVYMTAVSGKIMFDQIDPYYALFQFWTGEVAITAFIALAVVVLMSLFIERPFCKYACPYGALLGIFNLFRIFGLKRNAVTCTSCRACDRKCPMNIKISTGKTIRNHQCISCFECTSDDGACPVPDTLNFQIKAMEVNR